MLVAARLLLCLCIGAITACARLQTLPELEHDSAIPPGTDSPLDRATATIEAAHPRQSAFRLVIEGPEAFVSRAHSARLAARSLDIQTYIWHADLTGMFFANELIAAADRGVRVRF